MKTRIDFHSHVSDQLNYACRLVRKALAANSNLVVMHQDEAQCARFDELLWSFSATDFLPHVASDHPLAKHTPVLLTLHTKAMPPHRDDVLLNLSDSVPTEFDQFKHVIEIVPEQDQATQKGRERYRYYQQRGFQINHIHAK